MVDTSDPKSYAEATIDTVINSFKNQITYNPSKSPSPALENSFSHLPNEQTHFSPSPNRSPNRGKLLNPHYFQDLPEAEWGALIRVNDEISKKYH